MLKKNTKVWRSEFGYYNFIYRKENDFLILEENAKIIKIMNYWINTGNYIPMLIEYKNKKITIWIQKEK